MLLEVLNLRSFDSNIILNLNTNFFKGFNLLTIGIYFRKRNSNPSWGQERPECKKAQNFQRVEMIKATEKSAMESSWNSPFDNSKGLHEV